MSEDIFKAFCPNCEKITNQEFIQDDDHFLVDGQDIIVHLKYSVCLECGEDYEIPDADYDPLEEYYRNLGLRTYEDRKAFFEIHHIAFNISQMRQWLDFPKNRNSPLID